MITVNWYTLFSIFAIIGGIGWFFFRYHMKGLTHGNQLFVWLTPLIPISILGARLWTYFFDQTLYEKVISYETIGEKWRYFLGFTEDGLAGLSIHGGIIVGGLYLAWIFYFFSQRHRISFWVLADLAVQGLLICQIIGRWGNFFNQELLGPIITTRYPEEYQFLIPSFAKYLHFPKESDNIIRMPLFFYEMLGNFCLWLVLVSLPTTVKLFQQRILFRHRKWKLTFKPLDLKNSDWITYRPNRWLNFLNLNVKQSNYHQLETDYSEKLFGINRIKTLWKLKFGRNSQKLTMTFDEIHQHIPVRVGTQFSGYFIGYGIIRLILQPYRTIDDYVFDLTPNDPMTVTMVISGIFIAFGLLTFLMITFVFPYRFRSYKWYYEKWYRISLHNFGGLN